MNTTKVIFIAPGIRVGYSYMLEDVAELPTDKANYLIMKGICKEVPQAYTPLPKAMPYREDLLRAGFYSLELMQSSMPDEMIFIKDVGDRSVRKILESHKIKEFTKTL